MKRKLVFNEGIIHGSIVRAIVNVFPGLKESFKQRKAYDEYYYEPATVEVTIESIGLLILKIGFVSINHEEIIIIC